MKLPAPPSWSATVEGYWPRRLLHIPTMTSIRRTGEDTYNGVRKPKYGILTYTWGRWKRKKEDRRGPALEVKGTPWEIPSVKEEHFTVKAFRRVVQRMGQEVEWAWIDIACVEQRDGDQFEPAKMREIGLQARIFKNAACAFVWLSHVSTKQLEEHIPHIRFWSQPSFFDTIADYHKFWCKGSNCSSTYIPGLDGMENNFSAVLDDPWFSSMWTLQEIILRQDAFVLTREGNTVFYSLGSHHPREALKMTYLAKVYTEIREHIRRVGDGRDRKICTVLRQFNARILEGIDKAGFPVFLSDNPNVQYGVARYRQSKRPFDRIYAIMQIYGRKVGEAIEPRGDLTLDQLQDQFAGAICAKCPILGQGFVHLQQPPRGKAWRISQYSTVPEELQMLKDRKPKCTIKRDFNGHAIFEGKRCSFLAFERAWKELEHHKGGSGKHRLVLDNHTLIDLNLPRWESHCARKKSSTDVAAKLCERYKKYGVYVLELGTLFDPRFLGERSSFGIVARQVPVGRGVAYERVGVCIWGDFEIIKELPNRRYFYQRLVWENCKVMLV